MPTPPPQGGLGQSWFVLDYEAAYAGDKAPPTESPQDAGGGAHGGFYGPVGRRVRFVAPFAASLARKIEIRAQIASDAVRTITTSAPLEIHGAKKVQFTVDVVRQEAYVYAQTLREDDELIAVLLAAG